MSKEAVESKVLPNKFKGKPMFSVFLVDESGKPAEDDRPVVSMGLRKAQHLIVHLKELEAFVLENS